MANAAAWVDHAIGEPRSYSKWANRMDSKRIEMPPSSARNVTGSTINFIDSFVRPLL